MLLGRISREDKGAEIFGKKIIIKKDGGGEEYKAAGNFIHPCVWVKDDQLLKPLLPALEQLPAANVADPVLAKFGSRALYPERWEIFK